MLSKLENRVRRRKDPRSAATRIAVIEAAEGLFAESGFRSVSIREIGNAIGSSNAGIVGYYFGNKEELIEQIFHHRMRFIDNRRKELLDNLQKSNDTINIRMLLNILSSSLVAASESDRGWRFARLIIMQDNNVWLTFCAEGGAEYPATMQIFSCLKKLSNDDRLLTKKVHFMIHMIFAGICINFNNCGNFSFNFEKINEKIVDLAMDFS